MVIYKVSVDFNKVNVVDGYEVGLVWFGILFVKVMGVVSEVSKVVKVVVVVNINKNLEKFVN